MNRTKHIVKLLVFGVLAGILLLVGAGKDLSLGKGLSLSWAGVGRILLVIFAVLAVEHLLLLLLSLINSENHRIRTVKTLSANLVRYVTVIVIIICVLSLLNVDMPTILAGLGVIALIIGFGAESLITDVVTGFFILMDNQYNVGDIIEVGGFRGTVSEIGIRTTSLTDTGGNVKIINNSDMKNILNRSDHSSKAVTDFSIPYETDLIKLEQKIPGLMTEIFQAHPEVPGQQLRRSALRGGGRGVRYLFRREDPQPRPLCGLPEPGRGVPLPPGGRPQQIRRCPGRSHDGISQPSPGVCSAPAGADPSTGIGAGRSAA